MEYFHPENPNPNNDWNYDHMRFPAEIDDMVTVFELSDYLMIDDVAVTPPENVHVAATGSNKTTQVIQKCKNNINGAVRKKKKVGNNDRVAFRTKSELEIMDDGFKWRKYGKKSVKNSPNPRNYYKCQSEGCNVKKRVEREKEDSSYVITTYDGIHNHESPTLHYCNDLPNLLLPIPNSLALQNSSPSSSSS